jgi:hypothetical protein
MRGLLSLALFTVVGCGGDDGAGPSSPANVAGTRSASVSKMSGGGITCSSTAPTELAVNQSGSTFSGSYSGGELFCIGLGGTGSVPIPQGIVINGTVDRNTVTFDLDMPDSHFSGTVSGGSSMSGATSWRMDFGAPLGVITLNGHWGSAKQ